MNVFSVLRSKTHPLYQNVPLDPPASCLRDYQHFSFDESLSLERRPGDENLIILHFHDVPNEKNKAIEFCCTSIVPVRPKAMSGVGLRRVDGGKRQN